MYAIFKALGLYRLRQGYPYKYRFDILPKGKSFVAAGTVVFVPESSIEKGLRMKPVRIPPAGVLAENEEPSEENGVVESMTDLEPGPTSTHPGFETTNRGDV